MCICLCVSWCVHVLGCFGMVPCVSVFACLIGKKKSCHRKMCKKVQGDFDELAHVWRWEQECQGLLGGLPCQSSSGVNQIILQNPSIFSSLSSRVVHSFHRSSLFCSSDNVNSQYYTHAQPAEMLLSCTTNTIHITSVNCTVVVALHPSLLDQDWSSSS